MKIYAIFMPNIHSHIFLAISLVFHVVIKRNKNGNKISSFKIHQKRKDYMLCNTAYVKHNAYFFTDIGYVKALFNENLRYIIRI